MLNLPSGDSRVCTPADKSLKISPASAPLTCAELPCEFEPASGIIPDAGRRHAVGCRQRPRTRSACDDVVQIEAAGFEPPLEDANQIALHRVVVAVRLQNHFQRLPQRHVLQIAAGTYP